MHRIEALSGRGLELAQRQRLTHHTGAVAVRRAKNDSLFALTDGTVYFDQSGKRVNLTPAAPGDTKVR